MISIVGGSMLVLRDSITATVLCPTRPDLPERRICLPLAGEAVTVSDVRSRLTEAYFTAA